MIFACSLLILSFTLVDANAEGHDACTGTGESDPTLCELSRDSDSSYLELLQLKAKMMSKQDPSMSDACSRVQCTGLSTSCTNSCCTVSCDGSTMCSNLWCPQGLSSSCTNGDCSIDCKGGGNIPEAQGSCESYTCSTGVSSTGTNGVYTLSCDGVPFCSNLYCPKGFSSSCTNGACTFDCKGGSPCGQVCTEKGACAVYSDPHVAGFDSFRESDVPDHLIMTQVGALQEHVRPIDVNLYKTGDFWLVKSDSLRIQGRFVLSQEFVPDHAAVGAVAISGTFLDGKKVLIEAGGVPTLDGVALKHDGRVYRNLTQGALFIRSHEGAPVDGKPNRVVTVQLPHGVELLVVQFKKYLDTKITVPKLLRVDGECGNFNGVAADDTEEAVKKRMGTMQVAAHDIMF